MTPEEIIRRAMSIAGQYGRPLGAGPVVDLFSGTGVPSLPWELAGYPVEKFELAAPIRRDALSWRPDPKGPPSAVLAGVPCTDYAASGARHWARKGLPDETGISPMDRTNDFTGRVIRAVLDSGARGAVIENPIGRLRTEMEARGIPMPPLLRPEGASRGPSYSPERYGDAFSKKTNLYGWGVEIPPPEPAIARGGLDLIHRVSGWNKPLQALVRSAGPVGFWSKFFLANASEVPPEAMAAYRVLWNGLSPEERSNLRNHMINEAIRARVDAGELPARTRPLPTGPPSTTYSVPAETPPPPPGGRVLRSFPAATWEETQAGLGTLAGGIRGMVESLVPARRNLRSLPWRAQVARALPAAEHALGMAAMVPEAVRAAGDLLDGIARGGSYLTGVAERVFAGEPVEHWPGERDQQVWNRAHDPSEWNRDYMAREDRDNPSLLDLFVDPYSIRRDAASPERL